MPQPRADETKDDFISRCMGDSEARSDYPDEAQRRAVCESFWESRDMATIRGVEILKPGTWNQTKFTKDHLQKIADNFQEQDWEVPVKLGHDPSPSAPAYGWVRNIRVAGEKLVADFEDVPEKVFEMIKQKMFKNVSVEVFFNMERNKKRFDRALKAVALLGAQIPAVADLKPVTDSLTEVTGAESVGEFEAEISVQDDESNVVKSPEGARGSDSGDNVRMGQSSERNNGCRNRSEGTMSAFVTMLAQALEDSGHKDREQAIAALAEKSGQSKDDLQSLVDGKTDETNLSEDQVKNIYTGIRSLGQSNGGESREQELKQQVERLQAQLDQTDTGQQQVKELSEKLDRLQRERTEEKIENRIKSVQIPSLRHHVRALYELAHQSGDKVRMFDTEQGDFKQQDGEAVVDSFVDLINKQADKLFSEWGQHDETHRNFGGSGDASEEMDSAVKDYMQKNGVTDYAEAMDQVMAAQPDLAQRYAEEAQ